MEDHADHGHPPQRTVRGLDRPKLVASARSAVILLLAGLFASCATGQQRSEYTSGGPLSARQAAFDVTFYDLRLQIYPEEKRISGFLEVGAQIVSTLDTLVLDLDDRLDVNEISKPAAGFVRRSGQILIGLDRTHEAGETIAMEIAYGGIPREAPNPPWDGGFTWSETPSGEPWIATSNQTIGADAWWPVKDHPSDEPDSMSISITVPAGLTAASNGVLAEVVESGDRSTYRWTVRNPINTYNVSVNVAPYVQIAEDYHGVGGSFPITFFALSENESKARKLMLELREQLDHFEATLGPYPFRSEKLGVAEVPFLGMEHQTIIAYGADYDPRAMTGMDWDFDALLHHELAHEWWGNLVSCSDWKDMWLHEGFATYMQPLFLEQRAGRESYFAYLESIRDTFANTVPLARPNSIDAQAVYGADIYNKGAWVLHTLRYHLGDERFFKALRQIVYPDATKLSATDGSQARSIDTAQVQDLIETAAEENLDWFFETYLHQPALPQLKIDVVDGVLELEWETGSDLAFELPVVVRHNSESSRVEMAEGKGSVRIGGDETFEIDPEGWILMATNPGN